MFVISTKLKLVNFLFSVTVKPLSDKLSVHTTRRLLQRGSKAALPAGITRQNTTLGGVPVAIFRPPQSRTDLCIFYMHGGGHQAGNPDTHAGFLALLAQASGLDVIATDHRLAPEHPFPAGLDDATAAFDAVVASGKAPGQIIVMGDSAGGNFVFALLHILCGRGTPPGLAIGLSPWTDLTASGPSRRYNARADRVMVPRALEQMAQLYAGGRDMANPLISPIFGDFKAAPPVLIQVAESELLYSDADLMTQRLRSFGDDVTLQTWPDAVHCFQVMLANLPESRDAVQKILDFIWAHFPKGVPSIY